MITDLILYSPITKYINKVINAFWNMEGLVGRKVSVFYNDFERVNRKDGTCTNDNDEYITLDEKIIIPKLRIVRIEVL